MANPKHGFFTSESVSEGHPDKMADQISDAVLDAILAKDPNGRVACECLIKSGMILVSGEVTTDAWVDIEQIAREVVRDIGYSQPFGFDAESCAVLQSISQQSKDIASGIDHTDPTKLGAGDQGLMFGYASNETPSLMPAPIHYAHALTQRQAQCRKEHILPWLGPDAKSQITLRYQDHQPVGIDNVVFSTQHHPDIELDQLRKEVMTHIIEPTLPKEWCDAQTTFWLNPAGTFVLGGPVADCGLTGRKIIVDTYGGIARHGGGAFSGKDPSKVDRSAAYMARHIAKTIVAMQWAARCEVQLTYAIGIDQPTSIAIETFGTGTQSNQDLEAYVRERFDLSPYGIIQSLDLKRPIYRPTAAYGHFGHEAFSWEKVA